MKTPWSYLTKYATEEQLDKGLIPINTILRAMAEYAKDYAKFTSVSSDDENPSNEISQHGPC